jgi:hypothetical protein
MCTSQVAYPHMQWQAAASQHIHNQPSNVALAQMMATMR